MIININFQKKSFFARQDGQLRRPENFWILDPGEPTYQRGFLFAGFLPAKSTFSLLKPFRSLWYQIRINSWILNFAVNIIHFEMPGKRIYASKEYVNLHRCTTRESEKEKHGSQF